MNLFKEHLLSSNMFFELPGIYSIEELYKVRRQNKKHTELLWLKCQEYFGKNGQICKPETPALFFKN